MKSKRRLLIRQRLRNSFSLFALVPVILFCGTMAVYVSVSAVNESCAALVDTLSLTGDRLNQVLQQAYQIGRSVSEDDEIISRLTRGFGSDADRYLEELTLDNTLAFISRYYDARIQMYLIAENGGQYKSGVFSFLGEDFRQADWYRAILHSNDALWFALYEGSHVVRNERDSFIALGVPVRSETSRRALGAVLIEVRVGEILMDAQKGHSQLYIVSPSRELSIVGERVEQYDNDVVMTLDAEGVRVFGRNDPWPDNVSRTVGALTYWRPGFAESGFLSVNGYQLAYGRLSVSDWIMASTVETMQLFNAPMILGLLLLLGILCLSLIAVLAANAAARTATKPLLTLIDSVRMVRENNFDVVIERVGDDEIGELSNQFNKMVAHIKELMARIYQEQVDRRKYELLLLQAQINPHFLYNTLDSMLWLVRMKRNDEAATMLTALTTFFKTGLNKGRDTILLSQELQNVDSYMTVQQFRYKTKLAYETDVAGDVKDILLPKLILQPLIENAIYHGLKGKPGRGCVRLRCEMVCGALRIVVSDDGLGMSGERLADLREQLQQGNARSRDSYGVINVLERLRLFFPGRCAMEIDSEEGRGTRVTITIDTAAAIGEEGSACSA